MLGAETSSRKKQFRSETGGAAVELVVLFPFLVLLILGAIDYGRMFYTSVAVANAARAGAEWGSIIPANQVDTAGMRTFAEQDGGEVGTMQFEASRYCECGGATALSCTALCSSGAAPEVYVEVTARRTVNFLLPYPGIPNNFFISRKATFRVQ